VKKNQLVPDTFSLIFLTLLLLATTGTALARPAKHFDGEVTVLIIEDFLNERANVAYELWVAGESQPYTLKLPGPPPFAMRTGQRVRVFADELPGRRLGVKEVSLLEVGPGGGNGGGGKGGGGKGGGSRSSAVILINLLDADSVLTREQAESAMWGTENSVQDIYLQDTRGKIDFVRDSDNDGAADVYGPYDVAMTAAGSCSYNSWASAARQMAADEGVSLNNRDHYIYVITGYGTNSCSFGGVAQLGGDSLWINYPSEFVFFHELGHNLNLQHAGSDPDNDGRINSVYGDYSCMMGAAYRNVFFNAPHKEVMGILTASSGDIVDVPASAGLYNYILEPLALDEGVVDPQILKIPRDDLGRYYYISLRDSTSYDANLSSQYRTGASVHWYDPNSPDPSLTGYVTTLSDGESFVDLVNGITVTQMGMAADGSWVDLSVQIDDTYDVGPTGFDVTSLSGQGFAKNTVGPNELSQYALNVQNNDGPGTPPSTWTFSTRNLPAEMIATFDQSSLQLGPGESGIVALTIDPAGAVDGSNFFYVDAIDEDGAAPHHLNVSDYGYVVVDSVSIKPEPPTGLMGSSITSKGKLYLVLNWSASPSEDVVGYKIFFDDSPLPRYWRKSTGTGVNTRWFDDQGPYSFRVAAENSAGKLSEMSDPVTVNVVKGK
jgi:hypothetical protein